MFDASGAVKALNEEDSRSKFDVLQLRVSREINRNNLCNFVLIRILPWFFGQQNHIVFGLKNPLCE